MGAPVLAKLGQTLGSRASGAILHALGLADWVAENDEAYLALAQRKASDIEGLTQFRLGIRSRFLSSPAGNPERYTRAVEEAYRTMWLRWLSQSRETAAEALP
jgi:predicted O-linked N-acetylglucosamine transferase (SPINDLY family)